MNLLLLEPAELAADGTVRLSGRRARHALEVLRAAPGRTIRVGLVGGRMGEAEVLAAGEEEVLLAPRLERDPPPASPVMLLLALPRPKMLRRILQSCAAMGVKRVVLLGSWRVENSYFGSHSLAPEAIRGELLLGLEQGKDTVLPDVVVRRLFKPFVEDELDALCPPLRLLAHPGNHPGLDQLAATAGATALAVGPEGGWTAYEASALERRGFIPFSLGPRALRVDAAVPFAIGQVELWLRAAPRPGPRAS
jgi:RsmE family RNA methyltransferase